MRDDHPERPAWPARGEPDHATDQTPTPPVSEHVDAHHVTGPADRDTAGRPQPRRVFLSHSAELRGQPEPRSFVAAVEAAVSRAGDVMVDTACSADDPQPSTALDRDRVAAADVYLLLAGFRYGCPVRGRPELSYTEHELRVASERGMPRLVFLLSDRVQGSSALFVDPRYGDRQVGFRQRLRDAGVATADVHSPAHAETVIYDALTKLPRARSPLAPAGRIWGIPARPNGFVGRQDQLMALRAAFSVRKPAVVWSAGGTAGVGKTALALEYAHRNAGDYDVAWWVPASRPELIPDRLAALAEALGLAGPGDHPSEAVARLLGELGRHDRWLLVFDDAEDATELTPFLPDGGGHVLITSRRRRRGSIAVSVEVGEFTRRESVAVLRSHLPDLTDGEADRLARALGDLPLAVDQGGTLLATTGWTVRTYLRLLTDSAQRLRPRHDPAGGYPMSVAASWQVTFDQLAGSDAAALQLVTLAAWLAPDAIPLTVFTGHPATLPEPLATAVGDPLEWARALAVLRQRGVAMVDPDTLLLHRIPAALLRAHSPGPEPATGWAALAATVLRAAVPDDLWDDPAAWPVWRALLPHVVAVTDPAHDTTAAADDVDWLVEQLATHLHTRGEPRAARPLLERAFQRYRERLGDDHPGTLAIANNLAIALRELGEHDRADELDQDILTRLGHIVGDDTGGVAISLGRADEPPKPPAPSHPVDSRVADKHEQARKQGQETLDRRRRILGMDHPDTLNTAHNLAATLFTLGRYEQACTLGQDTLERRRRVLGDDHADTFSSARDLARTLHAMGRHEQATELDEWVARSRTG